MIICKGSVFEQMEKFRWILLALFFSSAAAQTDFLNLDCGAVRNYSDNETKMEWIIDSNEYIAVGGKANVSNFSVDLDSHLQSLRFFPKPYNKSCYSLPVDPEMPYLLRLWFHYGNYDGKRSPPSFNVSVETQGMLYRQMENIAVTGSQKWDTEKILTSGSDKTLYVCLIRILDGNDPFVSAIQLRKLSIGMYALQGKGLMLNSISRYDLGGKSLIRYPQDDYDRFWQINSKGDIYNSSLVVNRSTIAAISSDNSSSNRPPSEVMQTAIVAKENIGQLLLNATEVKPKTLIALYFGEIEGVNTSQSRIFNVTINGTAIATVNFSMDSYIIKKEVTLTSIQAREVIISLDSIKGQGNSSRGPLINALERYNVIDTEPETFGDDVSALLGMKNEFNMSDWISDPCFGIEWDGIKCTKDNLVRISEIDLSGRNLSGSLNYVCNLTRLEKLHLQNNRFSGPIPPCLSTLRNLRELYIQNNNFSGLIPNGLLHRKLDFRSSENPYLIRPKGKNKGVMIGSIIGGILSVLLLFISTLVCHRRYSAKQDASADLAAKAPNPVRSRSFSMAELKTATENFTHNIGQGGFGSVFYGKLPDENEIAVKVLSATSKQGPGEFKNEVDLLSILNHKNLVRLLGYCDSSKKLMLVYEYMGGKSLADHLHGSLANQCTLDWKARIRVALDAAEGLEYLHWRATPRIIHRDVKSSNILLDRNMRAKVADFGLSRILQDPKSHVTTQVKGTMGYMDPEYFRTNKLTERIDVFSFGVVLLEMICGRKPILENANSEEEDFVKWVMLHAEADQASSRRLTDIIDKRLSLSENEMECFNYVVDLAIQCVESEGSRRPTMSEVVEGLKAAKLYIEPKDMNAGKPMDALPPEEFSRADFSSSLLYVGR